MRLFIIILILHNFLFATAENITLVNQIKGLIQKEEYISLAINKYIGQTAKIPKDSDNNLDWEKLLVSDYLGENFNNIMILQEMK